MKNFDDCMLRTFDSKNYCENGGLLYRIPSNPKEGYHFEYLLFIPNKMKQNTIIMLESPNYGTDKNFNSEGEAIEYLYEKFKSFRNALHKFNSQTNYPIIYPLIPRKIGEEEIYTNQLSSNALFCKDKQFERIDLQIINMINNAKKRLLSNNIIVDSKIVIYGFSASAKFANRFTILHPDMINLCIAGGLAGCLTLPLKEYNAEKLLYPVGLGNINFIVDDNLEKFKKVKQFYFQGKKDLVDAFACDEKNKLPYFKGIITKEEMDQLHRIFGKKIKDRWIKTQQIYSELNINASFKTYEDGIHDSICANNEIIKLLKSVNKNIKEIK